MGGNGCGMSRRVALVVRLLVCARGLDLRGVTEVGERHAFSLAIVAVFGCSSISEGLLDNAVYTVAVSMGFVD